MRLAQTFSIAAMLLTLSAGTVRADAATAAKDVEWVMTLGCRHCHYAEQTGVPTCTGNCGPAAEHDGAVVALTGPTVPKDFKKGGRWLVKGTLSADGKTLAVREITARPPGPAELKEDKPAAKPDPDAKVFTGAVGRTGAGLPTLTAADQTRYGLKPSKAASVATRDVLTRIGGGDLTGRFTTTGTTYADDSRKWIVVDSIRAEDAPAKP